MDASQPVTRVTPDERTEGEHTPGMAREQAIDVPGMWAGFVRTETHATRGWPHHADDKTTIYMVSGSLRMESGPGGTDVIEARSGDFLRGPKGAIHRESNPGDEQSHIVVVRAGEGPAVVNVDGPAQPR